MRSEYRIVMDDGLAHEVSRHIGPRSTWEEYCRAPTGYRYGVYVRCGYFGYAVAVSNGTATCLLCIADRYVPV